MASRLKRPLLCAPADPPPMAMLGWLAANLRARSFRNPTGSPPVIAGVSPASSATISGLKLFKVCRPASPPTNESMSTPSAWRFSATITWARLRARYPSQPGRTGSHLSELAAVMENRESI